MKYAGLIIAAGASTRMGTPKQLLRLNGETLLDRAVRIAGQADLSPLIVVLGAAESEIRAACDLSGTTIVSNLDWREGMGSSIAVGVHALDDAAGVIVMTCDMPAVAVDHLRELFGSGNVTASAYAERKGVPAFFPRSVFPALMMLRGDTGARELLRSADAVKLPNGELDIDTPEDWSAAQKLFG
jgi:CTP:molybdopterin cytidylyltransferase MocA